MDEYQTELNALKQTLIQLKLDEAEPSVIEEYDCELRNLTSIYNAAVHAFSVGIDDPDLHQALADLGFGPWEFSNVYSFVYDAALDGDLDGEELSGIVDRTDYAASLRASLTV